MAKFLYFAGEVELEPKSVFYAGRNGRTAFGSPIGHVPVFIPGKGWDRGEMQVTRTVEYKSNPSKHVCDARCMNATGRTMKCECACGGKNHGRGAFACDDATLQL